MEILAVLLLIVILILVFNMKSKIDSIGSQLDSLKKDLKAKTSITPQKSTQKEILEVPNVEASPQPQAAPVVKPEFVAPVVPKPLPEKVIHVAAEAKSPLISPIPKPAKPPKPSFMERNPDLEKFIGENLLSKIGIVIFVIGMGFLVKLGIENNVITEVMRVAIGILIGGGMIGLAHYLRNSFSNFSSILIGGALCVLYFTIALAFHQYELISQIAAFIIMVLITSFGVLLAISYDRKALAILALIGGFGTPFFVSTGSGNFVTLLSYILILDIGMLALVYVKKWNVINYLSYGFTYILYSGVFVSKYIGDADASTSDFFLFLTAFYIIFIFMSLVYNVRNGIKFKFAEMGILLSNSAAYFGFGLALTQGYKDGLYSGLFTGLIALLNFGFAFILYKRKNLDKNVLYLLIGMVLTFLTLIAPIQLKGNYITLFWAMEGLLLFWLSQKSGIKILKLVASIITMLMVISLTMDWYTNYYDQDDTVILNVFLNKAFLTSLVSMVSVFAILRIFKEEETFDIRGNEIIIKPLYFKIIFGFVVYFGLVLELNYQFVRYELEDAYRFILLGIFNYCFAIALIAIQHFKPSDLLQKAIIPLSSLVILSYMTIYLAIVKEARIGLMYTENYSAYGFYAHYALFVLFLLVLVNLYRKIHQDYGFNSSYGKIALWILAFIVIFISSTEVGHISVIYQNAQDLGDGVLYRNAVKHIYPIVWAITALLLMISGMKFRLKSLRLASLVVFGITILKLFFYDLQGNSTGRIISFILLGVILLLISFLYQKLKFIIQDDEKKD
jgi:uncharacterized membrane protein